MAGTSEGARKARDKNLEKDPDFYSNIGRRSWSNTERSRLTGFALLPPEERAAKGRKGGKKTKSEYKTADLDEGQKEALAILQEEIRRASEDS